MEQKVKKKDWRAIKKLPAYYEDLYPDKWESYIKDLKRKEENERKNM